MNQDCNQCLVLAWIAYNRFNCIKRYYFKLNIRWLSSMWQHLRMKLPGNSYVWIPMKILIVDFIKIVDAHEMRLSFSTSLWVLSFASTSHSREDSTENQLSFRQMKSLPKYNAQGFQRFSSSLWTTVRISLKWNKSLRACFTWAFLIYIWE